ncbi:transmembrane amino acid transporter protein-domain-containing protein [Cerioporus squamosus]|nr:transmembrane amino acid transporter protein-domain-containing protein [Cerioporus squamosus]
MAATDKVDGSLKQRPVSDASSFEDSDLESVGVQIKQEEGHAIRYRTCSWQKTAALLFSEYICLAIMSFPWSFSVLGMVPGIIVTISVAASVQYTSLILWRFCLKHPEIRDVCDIGRMLFGGSELAYNVTSVFFILNNTFIQALHCLVGAKVLNTLTNSAACTVAFSAISACICFLVSLPRPLSQLSGLGTFSAITMGIAVLLAIIFSGIQDHPFGYIAGEEPLVTVIPVKGTTYVAGMSAFLNITYTFVGQITLPSFIAEMKNPKDFPKALWAVTIAEIVIFTLCGALMYHFVGNQYMTAPAFGSLQDPYKKIAFSFAIPTIVFLGSLYASVTGRFIFFRIFKGESKHRHENTVLGWAAWVAIIAATWVLAFIIAEVIPFFSDMLSLMSSLFDGWFGFIFWGMAYLTLYPGAARWAGRWRTAETLLNYFIILFGFYVLIAGTYTSVQSIIIDYTGQEVFSCASNGV